MKPHYAYAATVVSLHDGDTITLDILLTGGAGNVRHDMDLGFNVHRTPKGIVLEGQRVRLYGCNAPELSTDAGKLALAHLQSLIRPGDVVSVVSKGWDKYGGRVDAIVGVAGIGDIAQAMIAAGFSKPWDGAGVKPV